MIQCMTHRPRHVRSDDRAEPGGRPAPRRLAILGAGGHAAVLADCAHRTGRFHILGCYDDAGQNALERRPIPTASDFLGPIEQAAQDLHNLHDHRLLILGVGDLAARERILRRLQPGHDHDHDHTNDDDEDGRDERRDRFATVIDFSAVVSAYTSIAHGAAVFPRAVVNSRAALGPHAVVNTAAVIEHDVTLARNVHVAPNATLCGGVSVGSHTLIGAGATVIPSVRVGRRCTVAAGAVVVRDVPDGATVRGCPAR